MTLWSGGPERGVVNPGASQYLAPLREALFSENYARADELARKMQGVWSESYLPLGDLRIHQDLGGNPVVSGYRRALNLRDGVGRTIYTVNGVEYVREVFVSARDGVMVVHWTCSKKGTLNLRISSGSLLRNACRAVGDKEWEMSGKAPVHAEPNYVRSENPVVYDDADSCRGVRWVMRAGIQYHDGLVEVDTGGMRVQAASELVLYVAVSTGFRKFDQCPSGEGDAAAALRRAMNRPYA
jgi:alpha-L-fucosidase 2